MNRKENKTGYPNFEKEGLDAPLPAIECFNNQFKSYIITVVVSEYTSLCPKTGQPDYGEVTIEYEPAGKVMELKSLKLYMQAYRDKGIFYENAVNRILVDVVAACKPVRARVTGKFRPRGGMYSIVEASYPVNQ